MITIKMNEHCSWGNSIYWLNYEKRELTGHLTPVPKIGDKVICEMKSPNKFRHFKIYTFVKVKDFFDPPDQFFATVKDSGYVVETKEREFKFELRSRCPLCNKKFKKSFSKLDHHVGTKHLELMIAG